MKRRLLILFLAVLVAFPAFGAVTGGLGRSTGDGFYRSSSGDIILEKGQRVLRIVSNGSTEAVVEGDVLIIDTSDSDGETANVATVESSTLGIGVVLVGGASAADVYVIVGGPTKRIVKVAGPAIGIGDPLTVSAEGKTAMKGSWGAGAIFGIAMGISTGEAMSGGLETIEAWMY